MTAHDDDHVPLRNYPREDEARLIHQLFQARMVGLGYGQFIFDWDNMPADARKAWVECVSVIFNDRLRGVMRMLSDNLHVPHYEAPPWASHNARQAPPSTSD